MKKFNKNAQGFTLIELMIAVAIISILAAVALPTYQNYVAKSKATNGLATLNSSKIKIAESYSVQGQLTCNDSDNISIPNCSGAGILEHIQDNIKVTLTPDLTSGNLDWACEIEGPSAVAISNCTITDNS